MAIFKLCKREPLSPLVYYINGRSIGTVVKDCNNGGWLLIIAHELGLDPKIIATTKARCALTVVTSMKDSRNIDAVNIAQNAGNPEKANAKNVHLVSRKLLASVRDGHNVDILPLQQVARLAMKQAVMFCGGSPDAIGTGRGEGHEVVKAASYAAGLVAQKKALNRGATEAAAYAEYEQEQKKNALLCADICREAFGNLLNETSPNYADYF